MAARKTWEVSKSDLHWWVMKDEPGYVEIRVDAPLEEDSERLAKRIAELLNDDGYEVPS